MEMKIEKFNGEFMPVIAGIDLNEGCKLDIWYHFKDGSSVYLEDCKLISYKLEFDEVK